MGEPKSFQDPTGQGDFLIKFHELQCLININHVLSALYHNANVYNDTQINIKITSANNLDLQT